MYNPVPPGPEKVAAAAWTHATRTLDADIQDWVRRIESGEHPLKPAEAARLESLIATARVYSTATVDEAQIIAKQWDEAAVAARTSLQATINAVQPHVHASQQELLHDYGWTQASDARTLAGVIARCEGKVTADWDGLAPEIRNRISGNVRRAVEEGLGPEELARRLHRQVSGDMSFSRARAQVIARTELADAYDSSRSLLFNEYGAKGLLYGYEWDAMGDSCPICDVLHGRIFAWNEPPNRHHMCRCVSIPVLPDEDLASVPYGEWGPNARTDRVTRRNRDRLFQQQAPGWRPYWRMGPEQDAAEWAGTMPGIPARPGKVNAPVGSDILAAPMSDELLEWDQAAYEALWKEDMGKTANLMNDEWRNRAITHPEVIADTSTLQQGFYGSKELYKVRDTYVANDARTLKENARLRDGMSPDTTWVRNMDRLVETGTVNPPGVKVFRGTAMTQAEVDKMLRGVTLHDRAFQSTAFDVDDAESYAEDRVEGDRKVIVISEIRLKPGMHAVDVSGGEVVLPRNTKLRVVERRMDGKTVRLVMEVVDDTDVVHAAPVSRPTGIKGKPYQRQDGSLTINGKHHRKQPNGVWVRVDTGKPVAGNWQAYLDSEFGAGGGVKPPPPPPPPPPPKPVVVPKRPIWLPKERWDGDRMLVNQNGYDFEYREIDGAMHRRHVPGRLTSEYGQWVKVGTSEDAWSRAVIHNKRIGAEPEKAAAVPVAPVVPVKKVTGAELRAKGQEAAASWKDRGFGRRMEAENPAVPALRAKWDAQREELARLDEQIRNAPPAARAKLEAQSDALYEKWKKTEYDLAMKGGFSSDATKVRDADARAADLARLQEAGAEVRREIERRVGRNKSRAARNKALQDILREADAADGVGRPKVGTPKPGTAFAGPHGKERPLLESEGRRVQEALTAYPGRWQDVLFDAVARAKWTVGPRGYNQSSGGRIVLSQPDSPKAFAGVIVHEVGHTLEQTLAGLRDAEMAFWERRAGPNATLHPRDGSYATIGARKATSNWYSMKRYTQGNVEKERAFEIFTTGIEDVLAEDGNFVDDDYADFMYGCLVAL